MEKSKLIDRINKLAEYYLELFKYFRAKKLTELENILSFSRAKYYLDLHFYFENCIKSAPLSIIQNNNDIAISISDLEKFDKEFKASIQITTEIIEPSQNLLPTSPYQKLKEFKNIWLQKREEGSKQLFLCFPFLALKRGDELIYTPLYQVEADIEEDIKQGKILLKLKSSVAHLNIYGLRKILGDIMDNYITELPSDVDLGELSENNLMEILRRIVNIIKSNPINMNITFDVDSVDFNKIEPLVDKKEFEENHFYFKNNYIFWILNRFDFHLEKILEYLKNLNYDIKTKNSALEILNDEYFYNTNDTNNNTLENLHNYKFSLFLNEDQRKVIESALKNSITIVQGPPGTGKSHTITYLILELLEKDYKVLITSYKPKALEVIRDKLMKEGFLKQFMFVFWIKGDREVQKELLKRLEHLQNILLSETTIGNYENELKELVETRERLKHLFNEILKREKIFGFASEKKFYLEQKGLFEKYIDFVSVQIPEEIIDNINYYEDELWFKQKNTFIFKVGQNLNISQEEFIEILRILNQIIRIIDKEDYYLDMWQKLFLELIDKKDDESFIKFIDELKKKLSGLKEVYYSLEEKYKTLINDALSKFISLTLNELDYFQDFIQDFQDFLLLINKKISEEYLGLDVGLVSHILNYEISYEFLEKLRKKIELLENETKITRLDRFIDLFKRDRLDNKQKIIKEHGEELFKIFNERQDILENFDIRNKKTLAEIKLRITKFSEVINFLTSIYNLFLKKIQKTFDRISNSYLDNKISGGCFEFLRELNEDINIFLSINEPRLFYQNLQSEIKNIIRFFDFYILLTEFIKFVKINRENKQDIKIIDFQSNFINKPLVDFFIICEKIINLNDLFRDIKPNIQLKFLYIVKNNSLFRNFCELALLPFKIEVSFDEITEYIICLKFLEKNDESYEKFKGELNKIKSKYKNFITKELQINKDDMLNTIKEYIECIDQKIGECWYSIIGAKNNEVNSLINKDISYSRLVTRMIRLLRRTRGRKPISIEKIKEEIDFQKITDIFKVWIVNLDDVFKIFPIKQQFLFDYVIIDEASQVVPFYILPLMYLARKIVIVGDDKQLKSPELMFFDEEYNKTILYTINFPEKDEILSEFIIDRESSILKTLENFQRKIMLKEHFRCLPEIIQWSNEKFYGGRLKIMTEGAKRLGPAFEFKFIEGAQEENKINKKEAEILISDFIDLLKRDDYKDYSFGILSLFHDQADYLQRLFARKRSEDEELDKVCKLKKEPVIVSTVDGFQGDERDIIFYSFRYAPNSHSKIFTLEYGTWGENRINVAFTRARKKMVFYLSRKIEDFPSGLVKDFLLYAKNPQLEITGEEKFDSDFEKDVYERLKSRGYSICPQYKSCGYFVDLAIIFENIKIGIECDGWQHYDRYGNLNVDDIERQEVLERAGWKILRIPSSVYWKDPEGYIDDLCKKIEEIRYKEKIESLTKIVDQKDEEQIMEKVEIEDIKRDVSVEKSMDVDLDVKPFDINIIYSYPKILFNLAKWLKDNHLLSPRDRKFIYDMGKLLIRKYTLTEKQKSYLRKTVERAIKKGFNIDNEKENK